MSRNNWAGLLAARCGATGLDVVGPLPDKLRSHSRIQLRDTTNGDRFEVRLNEFVVQLRDPRRNVNWARVVAEHCAAHHLELVGELPESASGEDRIVLRDPATDATREVQLRRLSDITSITPPNPWRAPVQAHCDTLGLELVSMPDNAGWSDKAQVRDPATGATFEITVGPFVNRRQDPRRRRSTPRNWHADIAAHCDKLGVHVVGELPDVLRAAHLVEVTNGHRSETLPIRLLLERRRFQ